MATRTTALAQQWWHTPVVEWLGGSIVKVNSGVQNGQLERRQWQTGVVGRWGRQVGTRQVHTGAGRWEGSPHLPIPNTPIGRWGGKGTANTAPHTRTPPPRRRRTNTCSRTAWVYWRRYAAGNARTPLAVTVAFFLLAMWQMVYVQPAHREERRGRQGVEGVVVQWCGSRQRQK